MFSFILWAASAAASIPIPVQPKGSPANWVRADDLPKIDGTAAMTTFDLTIDSSGRPIDCSIIVHSGSDQLDAAVCTALMKRARFKPSKDIDGTEVASVFRDRVVWLPSKVGPNYWFAAADIVVSTPMLTEQTKAIAEVVVTTEAGGGDSSCVIKKSFGRAELDKLACSVAANPKVSPPIVIDGRHARGVRLLRVAFDAASAEKVTIR